MSKQPAKLQSDALSPSDSPTSPTDSDFDNTPFLYTPLDEYSLTVQTNLAEHIQISAPEMMLDPNSFSSADIHPNGERIALVSSTIKIFNTALFHDVFARNNIYCTDKPTELKHDETPTVVRFSPCGLFLACGTTEGSVCIYHQQSVSNRYRDLLKSVNRRYSSTTNLNASLPPRPFPPLSITTTSGGVDVDDEEQWLLCYQFKASSTSISDIAWAPDSSRLVTGGVDTRVSVWAIPRPSIDPQTGLVLSLTSQLNKSRDTMLPTTASTSTPAAQLGSPKLQPEPICFCDGHKNWITGLAYDPLGIYIATQDASGTIFIWRSSVITREEKEIEIFKQAKVLYSNRLFDSSYQPLHPELAIEFLANAQPNEIPCTRIHFAPDGSTLVVVNGKNCTITDQHLLAERVGLLRTLHQCCISLEFCRDSWKPRRQLISGFSPTTIAKFNPRIFALPDPTTQPPSPTPALSTSMTDSPSQQPPQSNALQYYNNIAPSPHDPSQPPSIPPISTNYHTVLALGALDGTVTIWSHTKVTPLLIIPAYDTIDLLNTDPTSPTTSTSNEEDVNPDGEKKGPGKGGVSVDRDKASRTDQKTCVIDLQWSPDGFVLYIIYHRGLIASVRFGINEFGLLVPDPTIQSALLTNNIKVSPTSRFHPEFDGISANRRILATMDSPLNHHLTKQSTTLPPIFSTFLDILPFLTTGQGGIVGTDLGNIFNSFMHTFSLEYISSNRHLHCAQDPNYSHSNLGSLGCVFLTQIDQDSNSVLRAFNSTINTPQNTQLLTTYLSNITSYILTSITMLCTQSDQSQSPLLPSSTTTAPTRKSRVTTTTTTSTTTSLTNSPLLPSSLLSQLPFELVKLRDQRRGVALCINVKLLYDNFCTLHPEIDPKSVLDAPAFKNNLLYYGEYYPHSAISNEEEEQVHMIAVKRKKAPPSATPTTSITLSSTSTTQDSTTQPSIAMEDSTADPTVELLVVRKKKPTTSSSTTSPSPSTSMTNSVFGTQQSVNDIFAKASSTTTSQTDPFALNPSSSSSSTPSQITPSPFFAEGYARPKQLSPSTTSTTVKTHRTTKASKDSQVVSTFPHPSDPHSSYLNRVLNLNLDAIKTKANEASTQQAYPYPIFVKRRQYLRHRLNSLNNAVTQTLPGMNKHWALHARKTLYHISKPPLSSRNPLMRTYDLFLSRFKSYLNKQRTIPLFTKTDQLPRSAQREDLYSKETSTTPTSTASNATGMSDDINPKSSASGSYYTSVFPPQRSNFRSNEDHQAAWNQYLFSFATWPGMKDRLDQQSVLAIAQYLTDALETQHTNSLTTHPSSLQIVSPQPSNLTSITGPFLNPYEATTTALNMFGGTRNVPLAINELIQQIIRNTQTLQRQQANTPAPQTLNIAQPLQLIDEIDLERLQEQLKAANELYVPQHHLPPYSSIFTSVIELLLLKVPSSHPQRSQLIEELYPQHLRDLTAYSFLSQDFYDTVQQISEPDCDWEAGNRFDAISQYDPLYFKDLLDSTGSAQVKSDLTMLHHLYAWFTANSVNQQTGSAPQTSQTKPPLVSPASDVVLADIFSELSSYDGLNITHLSSASQVLSLAIRLVENFHLAQKRDKVVPQQSIVDQLSQHQLPPMPLKSFSTSSPSSSSSSSSSISTPQYPHQTYLCSTAAVTSLSSPPLYSIPVSPPTYTPVSSELYITAANHATPNASNSVTVSISLDVALIYLCQLPFQAIFTQQLGDFFVLVLGDLQHQRFYIWYLNLVSLVPSLIMQLPSPPKCLIALSHVTPTYGASSLLALMFTTGLCWVLHFPLADDPTLIHTPPVVVQYCSPFDPHVFQHYQEISQRDLPRIRFSYDMLWMQYRGQHFHIPPQYPIQLNSLSIYHPTISSPPIALNPPGKPVPKALLATAMMTVPLQQFNTLVDGSLSQLSSLTSSPPKQPQSQQPRVVTKPVNTITPLSILGLLTRLIESIAFHEHRHVQQILISTGFPTASSNIDFTPVKQLLELYKTTTALLESSVIVNMGLDQTYTHFLIAPFPSVLFAPLQHILNTFKTTPLPNLYEQFFIPAVPANQPANLSSTSTLRVGSLSFAQKTLFFLLSILQLWTSSIHMPLYDSVGVYITNHSHQLQRVYHMTAILRNRLDTLFRQFTLEHRASSTLTKESPEFLQSYPCQTLFQHFNSSVTEFNAQTLVNISPKESALKQTIAAHIIHILSTVLPIFNNIIFIHHRSAHLGQRFDVTNPYSCIPQTVRQRLTDQQVQQTADITSAMISSFVATLHYKLEVLLSPFNLASLPTIAQKKITAIPYTEQELRLIIKSLTPLFNSITFTSSTLNQIKQAVLSHMAHLNQQLPKPTTQHPQPIFNPPLQQTFSTHFHKLSK